MYAKVHSHQSWHLRVTDSYRQRANNCEQTVKNFVTLTKHIQDIMHKNVTWPKLVPSTFWFKTRHSRSKGVNQGSDIKRSTTSSLKKMDLYIPISSVVAYCPIKTERSIWCAVTSMDPSNYLRRKNTCHPCCQSYVDCLCINFRCVSLESKHKIHSTFAVRPSRIIVFCIVSLAKFCVRIMRGN